MPSSPAARTSATGRSSCIEAPRFGIVGKDQTIRAAGASTAAAPARPSSRCAATARRSPRRSVRAGAAVLARRCAIEHGGANVVEIEAEAARRASSPQRQQQGRACTIEGIREKLRVLLVSGEPHAGRAHLAQPPEVGRQRRPRPLHHPAPAREAGRHADQRAVADRLPDARAVRSRRSRSSTSSSSTATPTRASCRSTYFDNIVRYVRDGGAVLVAAGPEFAVRRRALRGRALSPIIPGRAERRASSRSPTRPRITDHGKRHPVTRDLPGSDADPPAWGEWLRIIGTQAAAAARP